MTKQDTEKFIGQLKETIGELVRANETFKQEIIKKVNETASKVEKKHAPVYFEQDIMRAAQEGIIKAIGESLTGYNSPLNKLTSQVIEENSGFLRELIKEAFNTAIKAGEFKKVVQETFIHKIARSFMTSADSMMAKMSNELKQDPVFKSKLVIAIENVINECVVKKA